MDTCPNPNHELFFTTILDHFSLSGIDAQEMPTQTKKKKEEKGTSPSPSQPIKIPCRLFPFRLAGQRRVSAHPRSSGLHW